MMHNRIPTPGMRRLLSVTALALATGSLAGCYYPPPPVAYCLAPPQDAKGQPVNVPLQPNGACPQGTQPVYAQAGPGYGYAPAYGYPYYPYGYPAYPPVAVGLGVRIR